MADFRSYYTLVLFLVLSLSSVMGHPSPRHLHNALLAREIAMRDSVTGPASSTTTTSTDTQTTTTASSSTTSSSSSSSSSSSTVTSSSSSSSTTSTTTSTSSTLSSSSSSISTTTTTSSSTSSSSSSSTLPTTSTLVHATTSSSSTALTVLSSHSSAPRPSSTVLNKSIAVVVIPTTVAVAPQATPAANAVTTAAPDVPTTTVTANTQVNAASTGFWGNKGEVAGTFVAVGLVVVLGLWFVVARKRRSKRDDIRDTFYDTKAPVDPVPGRNEHNHSPGPSMISLNNDPLDAHMAPVPNYGHQHHDQYLIDTTEASYGAAAAAGEHAYNPYHGEQQAYGADVIGYPPGASYAADPADAQYNYQHYYNTAAVPGTAGESVHQSHDAGSQSYYSEGSAYDQQYSQQQQHYSQQQQQYSQPAASNPFNGQQDYLYPSENTHDGAYSVTPDNFRPSLSPHPYSHPAHTTGVPRDSAADSFYGGTAV